MADKEKPAANFQHIVRVANVDLPGDKQIRFALTKIKGIGINLADALCALAKVDRHAKTGYLSSQDVEHLTQVVTNPIQSGLPVWMFNRRMDFDTGEDKHVIMGTLAFVHDNDLKRLKKIKSYVGVRHIRGLPVRGQRTRSHFRKNKGKVVGVAKKKAEPGKESKDDKKDKK